MDFDATFQSVDEALSFRLFSIGKTQVTSGTLLVMLVIVLATYILSVLAQRSIDRMISKSGFKGDTTGQIARRLTRYAIFLGGLVAALQTIGIDLSTLFAAGAVFAVGLGFAMQNIAQNFVSGVILLIERSIKPGDVLEVEKEVVRVISMGIRSTVVRTRNEEEIIVPNSILVQSMVKNFTLSDSSFLLKAEVGVIYGSDMKLVKQVLESAANSIEWREKSKEPRVLMREFGDSSVVFSVFVWIGDPWLARRYLSDLNEAIWWALKAAGITIAFPQLDVHFDKPVERSLMDISRATGRA